MYENNRYEKQYIYIAQKSLSSYTIFMELKERILNLRTEHGLSQRQLAEEMGTTRYRISELENGHRSPSLKEMQSYSAFFSMPLEYFSTTFQEDHPIPNMADKELLQIYLSLQELKEEDPDVFQFIMSLIASPKGRAAASLLSRHQKENLDEGIIIGAFQLLRDTSKDAYTYNEALRYIWNQKKKEKEQ